MCPQTLRSMQFVDPNLSFPGGRSSRYEIAAINAKSWRCWRPEYIAYVTIVRSRCIPY
jgi:hypothetical protein